MAAASDEVGVEATPGGYTLRLSGQAPASPPPARSGRLTNERAMANTDDRRASVPHFLVVISSVVATQPPTTP